MAENPPSEKNAPTGTTGNSPCCPWCEEWKAMPDPADEGWWQCPCGKNFGTGGNYGKEWQEEKSRKALDELTSLSQKMGLYDEEPE